MSFKKATIDVEYQNFQHPIYQQKNGSFISHMSVIDLLFNEGPNSKKIIMSGDNTVGYSPYSNILSDVLL